MEYLADVYHYGKLGQRKNPALAENWQKKADALAEQEKVAQTVLPLPQSSDTTPASHAGKKDKQSPGKTATAEPVDQYDEVWLR